MLGEEANDQIHIRRRNVSNDVVELGREKKD